MIKTVIWDIGGVILSDIDVPGFWKDIIASKQLRKDFGTNKITQNEFINQGSKLLLIDEDEFLRNYKKVYSDIKPIKETYELYKNMKTAKYILTDTNLIHAEFVSETFPDIFKLAKKCYLSNEIGMRKDCIDVFQYVVKDLELLPSEILFIDNKEKATNIAREAGLNAIHYKSPEKLKEELEKLNVK